jgi:hypothetical protein
MDACVREGAAKRCDRRKFEVTGHDAMLAAPASTVVGIRRTSALLLLCAKAGESNPVALRRFNIAREWTT